MVDTSFMSLWSIFLFLVLMFNVAGRHQKDKDKCATPPKLRNGTVANVTYRGIVKIATYKCDFGFKLWGVSYKDCTKYTGWSKFPISCRQLPTLGVKLKIRKLVKDIKEVEETKEGKELTVAIVVTILVVLSLVIHCCRVVAKRKSLKSKINDVVKTGDKPTRELPTILEINNDLLMTSCCCGDSQLPKTFGKKKKKKRKKKEKDEDKPQRDGSMVSNINVNSTTGKTTGSRDRHFRFKNGRYLYSHESHHARDKSYGSTGIKPPRNNKFHTLSN